MKTMRARAVRAGATALLITASAATVSACHIVSSGADSHSPVTYYLSPSGNDGAAGTSPATAWRTLGRASAASLKPGTRLLLQAGAVFTGQLTLGPKDGGSATDPVVVGTYGNGTAKIHSPIGSGVYVHDTGGVEIENLQLTGSPHPGEGDGINAYNDLPAGHRLGHITISNVSASGFIYGITVGGLNKNAGFSDVKISNANLHDNIDAGLLTYGPTFDSQAPTYANQRVTVSNVQASMNRGNRAEHKQDTGNGIVLGSVDAGSVIWSTANDNGGLGVASEGPAGIWTYDSTGVNIEHNLSYGNKTPNKIDGNGFGLDQNTADSVLQYNLSYGNDGTGYLLYSALNNGSQKDNIIRDNISSNDVRDGNTFYAGITVIGYTKNSAVYQNTVVMDSAATGTPPLLRLGPAVRGISILNNLFSTESGPAVATSSPLSESAVMLQGNDYFSVLGPWQVVWGQTIYNSLSDWRAGTSQETAAGQPTGLDVDPEMEGPVLGLSVNSPMAPAAAAGFGLRPGSPLIGAGLDLIKLGVHPAATDYTGQTQPVQHPNVGAL
jgi:hypothetical protein